MLIVWGRPDDLSERSLRTLANLIDDDERERASRFVLARDRDAFVTAHGVLRLALSRVGFEHPAAWRFERTASGRPAVVADAIAFSLTHSRTLVACAIVRAGRIGIDAEEIASEEPDPALLEASCTPDEAASIRAHAPAVRAWAFAQLWTRKEAAAKALDLARNFEPQAFAFGTDGTLRESPLIAPKTAHELAFSTVVDDGRHVVTLAFSSCEGASGEHVISRVDDEWVTFGPMRRDA